MGYDILGLLRRCQSALALRGLSEDDGPDDFRGLMVDLRETIAHLEKIPRPGGADDAHKGKPHA
jgi:hypothetical protein